MTQTKWSFALDPGETPKYMALVNAIEQAIRSGELKPNERLPTNRELCQMADVTIATVTKAMAMAARRGLIVAQAGSGTYVRGAADAEMSPAGPIDLSLNILPEAVALKELQSLVQSQPDIRLAQAMFGYGSYIATPEHARSAVSWMAGFGVAATAADVLLTVGVHQGLMAAFHALLSPGESAVCEEMTYTGIKRIAAYRQVRLLGARCDEHGVLPDSVEAQLKLGARVVVVTPALHNPTTAMLPGDRREAIARLCRQYDAYLIEDGVNMPMTTDALASVSSHAPERSILLTGLSKCVASGFRLGYAVVPPALNAKFHEALVSTQWIGPHLYAALAEQLLATGLVDRCTQAHRNEARLRHELASRILKGVRPTTTHGYHAWVDAPADALGDGIAMEALRLGVRISQASHFEVSDAGARSAAFRISLGAVEDRAVLEQALRILAGIGAHQRSTVSTLI